MESFSGDTEDGTEDILGHKKSKRKSLKSRLFGRSKRADAEETAKLSQSASDVTAGKQLGSDEDLLCSQGMMGSRALSHDSIFLAEDATDAEPARVLSQENVHGKIKALQMKLQLQKMHFGPPPMVLPARSPEELGSRSDDNLHQSSHDASGEVIASQETLTKTTSQPASRPLSPVFRSAQTKSLPPTPSHPLSLSVLPTSSASTAEPPLDFSTPAHFTSHLDTSAARHRMSVKPRNQRASTKKKLSTVTPSWSPLPTLNNIDLLESVSDQEQQPAAQEEEVEKADEGGGSTPSHHPLKTSEVSPATSDAAPKPPSLSVLQQDHALPVTAASLVLRPKPHTRAEALTRERPHSSFIESEMKDRREVDFGKQALFHDKKHLPNKAVKTETPPEQLSAAASRSSSAQQWPQAEDQSTKGIKRPAPGSGSFKFSISTFKNQDEDRPRSISFAGVLGQTEARQKAVGGTEEKSVREKEELTSSPSRGSPFSVGRLRQEGAPLKNSLTPQDRKAEPVTSSKNPPVDTGAVEAEEMDSSQELVEEAEEAKEVQEEEGKTAFGIKLRATSQSLKYRSETSSSRHSKTLQHEHQGGKQRRLETGDSISRVSEKLIVNTSSALKPADAVPSGVPLPAKHTAPPTDNTPTTLTEVQKISSNLKETQTPPQEPQPAPQTSSSEVSWMSLAMEKTRSLQQLFSSRFPRDFTGVQAPARPQAQQANQTEPATWAHAQTQAAAHPPADAAKEEPVQSRSQAQTVRPSTVAAQQKMTATSPVQSNASRESQTSKQAKEDQPQPSTAQSVSHAVSHPAPQTNPWTAQSPLRSSSQTATTSPASHPAPQTNPWTAQSPLRSSSQTATTSPAPSCVSSGQQQPSWSSRCLQQPATQPKSTSSALTVSAGSASDSASERGERDACVQREDPSLSARRAVWTGSVGERAAVLDKRAEWTTSPLLKGVELRKSQTEMQTSGDPPSPAKTAPVGKDTSADGRQEMKPADSSPVRVAEKPREDRWLRKNLGSSPSLSSSPTQPSVLQSMSGSGQPSWMELAKRKSMAWSDKSMD